MADLIRNALAAIGALVVAAIAWGSLMWAWTRRADRKRRNPLDIPPADDPAWDRLYADLLNQDRRRRRP